MNTIDRRQALHTLGGLSVGWLGGCGGGGGGGEAMATELTVAAETRTTTATAAPVPVRPPSREPTPPNTTPLPVGKYRTAQPYLFQPVPRRTLAKRLPEGSDMPWDIFGPTYKYVSYHAGWMWTRPGGDWIDANGARHGSTPWFSIPVAKTAGGTAVASYDGDVTNIVRFVQSKDRWCAFLLVPRGAERAIAGNHHASQKAPYIDVVYSNGQAKRLACRIVALSSASAGTPYSTAPDFPMPAFIEFERPLLPVASARMYFVITQHWSGSNARVEGYLLDPPVNNVPAVNGVAAAAGPLDEGIESLSAVIGAHRYLDTRTWSDFLYDGDRFQHNFGAERNFDPAIYGTGAQDLTKFPHVGLGKWVGAAAAWSLVPSSYKGDGFEPLAPGLGAVRIPMPAEPGVGDGSVVGSSGTLAGNAMIFLPEPMFGRLGRIFVRYYFRLGAPYSATSAKRFHVYSVPGTTDWTSYGGKFGIGPDHTTSFGGVSGSSGGGGGWQMRHSWSDCDAGTGGPDEGGWAAGFHLFDFLSRNPPGHNYGSDGLTSRWGQRGGTGGVLYAGQWYCVETELKLNTVTPSAPGFMPDGELRAWIDGRLAFERTGMVFRTLPIVNAPYNSSQLRPCRELGVRGLWLNWFHGGKTLATFDRTTFYTGLVWSRDYIGPMRL